MYVCIYIYICICLGKQTKFCGTTWRFVPWSKQCSGHHTILNLARGMLIHPSSNSWVNQVQKTYTKLAQ